MSKLRDNPMLIFYLGLLLILTHFSICNGSSVLDLNALKGSETDVKVGDCITEPEMDSETNRRVLAMQKKYISYETLKKDLVPCARPGASYYNCHAVAANPYNRGCEVITRCRDDHLSVVVRWKKPYVLVQSNFFQQACDRDRAIDPVIHWSAPVLAQMSTDYVRICCPPFEAAF